MATSNDGEKWMTQCMIGFDFLGLVGFRMKFPGIAISWPRTLWSPRRLPCHCSTRANLLKMPTFGPPALVHLRCSARVAQIRQKWVQRPESLPDKGNNFVLCLFYSLVFFLIICIFFFIFIICLMANTLPRYIFVCLYFPPPYASTINLFSSRHLP
jgi:hypothetical protein